MSPSKGATSETLGGCIHRQRHLKIEHPADCWISSVRWKRPSIYVTGKLSCKRRQEFTTPT